MNNIQKMQNKACKAMKKCVNADIELYGKEEVEYVNNNKNRREIFIDIRKDCKRRLLRKAYRSNNIYEASKRERDFWSR